MADITVNQLLNLAQVAAFLGISKRSIYRLMQTDALFPKPVRLGKAVRIPSIALEAYIQRKTS